MKKIDSSDAKRYGIVAAILAAAEIVKDIWIWDRGRKKGHKDCEEVMTEAKKTIIKLRKRG